MIVIGLTAPIGSGKNEFATALEHMGFFRINIAEILEREALLKGLHSDWESLQDLGDTLRQTHGASYLAKKALAVINASSSKLYLVNGIKNPAEVIFLQENLATSFKLIGLKANKQKRFFKLLNSTGVKQVTNIEEFEKLNARDFGEGQPEWGHQVSKCLELADLSVDLSKVTPQGIIDEAELSLKLLKL